MTNNGNALNGTIGMVQCLKKEPKGDKIRCLFNLDYSDNNKNKLTMSDELIKKDMLMNVMRNNEIGYIADEIWDETKEEKVKAKCVYLDIKTKGDLSSFRWFQAIHEKWNGIPTEVLKRKSIPINVYYSALNFRDIMIASGRISTDGYPAMIQLANSCIGIEYSGIDEQGQRIMGLCENQGISNSLLIDEKALRWKVPETMTLEEAATIPVCYYTAYYALIIRGKLKSREKILIHAGSGGVGQAAISI